MRDTWIDEHTGDELAARPDFEAELRAELARELGQPARLADRRRTPWRAIGWASVAAAAVVTTVVVVGNDDDKKVGPGVTVTSTTVESTSPSTSPSTSVSVDEADLLISAEGGPLLAPEIVATLDVPAGIDYSRATVLPDRYVIAVVENSRFTGTIISFDRNGNRLPDTTLDVAPTDIAGVILGGYDGTLYIETYPEVENTQTTKAYTLDGTVWREVDSYFVEENNDASYHVTGDGLLLGSELVIPAQSAIEDGVTATIEPLELGVAGFDVVRTPAGGVETRWRVVEDFDAGVPATATPYGDGAIFVGGPTGDTVQPYVAILRGTGANEFFRLNGWEFAAADDNTALFGKVVDGQLRLGVLGGAPRVDWVAGEIFGFGIGFHTIDEVSATISAVYGEPTADSGWYTIVPVATGDEDCLAGREVRVLHWGDLTLAFSKMNAMDGVAGEFLWSWVVGDLRASGFDGYREPTPAPAGTPTELTTAGGIGLGTTAAGALGSSELILSDFPAADGSRTGQYFPTGVVDETAVNRGLVVDADGAIIGFGTTQSFC